MFGMVQDDSYIYRMSQKRINDSKNQFKKMKGDKNARFAALC